MGQEDHFEIRTGRSAGTHGKHHARLWMPTLSKDFWPPQSPDFNPLDLSLWTHIEEKACKTRHSNTDLKLKVDEKRLCQESPQLSFRPRLEHVIASKKAHIQ